MWFWWVEYNADRLGAWDLLSRDALQAQARGWKENKYGDRVVSLSIIIKLNI